MLFKIRTINRFGRAEDNTINFTFDLFMQYCSQHSTNIFVYEDKTKQQYLDRVAFNKQTSSPFASVTFRDREIEPDAIKSGHSFIVGHSPYKLRISMQHFYVRSAFPILFNILMRSSVVQLFKIIINWEENAARFKDSGQYTVYLKHDIRLHYPDPIATRELIQHIDSELKKHSIMMGSIPDSDSRISLRLHNNTVLTSNFVTGRYDNHRPMESLINGEENGYISEVTLNANPPLRAQTQLAFDFFVSKMQVPENTFSLSQNSLVSKEQRYEEDLYDYWRSDCTMQNPNPPDISEFLDRRSQAPPSAPADFDDTTGSDSPTSSALSRAQGLSPQFSATQSPEMRRNPSISVAAPTPPLQSAIEADIGDLTTRERVEFIHVSPPAVHEVERIFYPSQPALASPPPFLAQTRTPVPEHYPIGHPFKKSDPQSCKMCKKYKRLCIFHRDLLAKWTKMHSTRRR